MFFAFQPWKSGVTREEIRPAFEGLRHINAEFEGPLHHRGARVWSEDVRPEFRARVAAADIHNHANGVAAFCRPLTWKTENHVERRPNTGFGELPRSRMNGFDFLEILVHEVHDFFGAAVGTLRNLRKARTVQKLQFFDG